MIDVYCVDLSGMDRRVYDALYAQASPQRQARADRYRLPADRQRCVAADAVLRYAVGRTLGISVFTEARDGNGKPYLPEAEHFHFNLSHSGRWVVLACGETPLGIDVEAVDGSRAITDIAGRYFTEAERRYIFSEAENQAGRFCEIWTAKEGYLKYLGTGLTRSLDSFCVLSMTEPRFHTRTLEGGYCLTLCAAETEHRVTWLKAEQLTGHL